MLRGEKSLMGDLRFASQVSNKQKTILEHYSWRLFMLSGVCALKM
jgi:hypothetical protein